MKPTFTPKTPDGAHAPIEYVPVNIKVGDITHKMALHLELTDTLPDQYRNWVLSHTKSGLKVLTVVCSLKGCPCSSAGQPATIARKSAIVNMASIVARVGVDKVNAKIAAS